MDHDLELVIPDPGHIWILFLCHFQLFLQKFAVIFQNPELIGQSRIVVFLKLQLIFLIIYLHFEFVDFRLVLFLHLLKVHAEYFFLINYFLLQLFYFLFQFVFLLHQDFVGNIKFLVIHVLTYSLQQLFIFILQLPYLVFLIFQ